MGHQFDLVVIGTGTAAGVVAHACRRAGWSVAVIEGRRLLIAAGAKPADLGFEGREHLVTSEQFLDIDVLPPRVLFVGGGYISFEFGHVAARAGATVTIVHEGARPLNEFEPDLVDL